MIIRTYYKSIWKEFDSEKPMVLISGPRQSGKTTFAKNIANKEKSHLYFNYDIQKNKALLSNNPSFFEKIDIVPGHKPLIVLDEIHKHTKWKNYLKGIYDEFSDTYRFLITGSGRLDIFTHGGDSLAGRYLHFHLFPFTIGELASNKPISKNFLSNLVKIPDKSIKSEEHLECLMKVGGFPEPFLKRSQQSYRRWANTYHSQIIREDIRDALTIKNIDAMETLYALLNNRVGALFSASSIAPQLKISHATILSWMKIFEKFYLIFKLKPYSKNISRTLLREPKYYFYDFANIENEGLKFENLVAVELKRAVTLWKDYGLGDYDLYYIRNKEKEEVDFIITKNNTPFLMIETKLNKTNVSKNLIKFQNILNIPAVQLVQTPGVCRKYKNNNNLIIIISAGQWLSLLN